MKKAVISCLFTASPLKARVYRAPLGKDWDCCFFSNSRVVGEIAERAGWSYRPAYAPVLHDEVRSSLAAKQAKFLHLLALPAGDLSIFEERAQIIYHDHKVRMQSEHVEALFALMETRPDKHLFNFTTPRYKGSIFDEVSAALEQQRYRDNMGPTLDFIGDALLSGATKAENRITRTTVIAYRNSPEARQLLRDTHIACMTLDQPECQIFWSAYSQRLGHLIHTEAWNSPSWQPPEWKAPEAAPPEQSEGPEGLEEIVLHSGENIITYSNDLITTQIRRWGSHTRPEYAFATRKLSPGSKVFDLAAHIGTFALAASHAVGHRGLVLAVEGNARIYRLLRDNLSNCPCTISVNCYVGSGAESICVDDASLAFLPGNSMGTKAVLAGPAHPAPGPTAKAWSLDELAETFFAPNLIKLDLEGLEGRTIMGSHFIRQKRPDLYFEVCDEHQRHFGCSVSELMRHLAELGYKFSANVGERNAAHENFICSDVIDPGNYKTFWDVYCSAAS